MSQESPEQIRARIENTRENLSADVNSLAETVKPGNVARRQVDKVKDAAGSARDKVMGTVSGSSSGSSPSVGDKVGNRMGDARSAVAGAASSTQQAVSNAPGAVRARTEGNPLAAGLIAFGAGMLLGSLLPATRQEEKAAAALKENASALTGPATEAVKEVGENLRGSAEEAVESVRSSATDAAQTVKEEAASAGQDVKEQGLQAKENVQESRS